MPPHIVLTTTTTFENVSLVGTALKAICRSVISEAEAYQFELGVVEACNNIIEHAYQYNPDGEFSIHINFFNDRIVCTMRYGGHAFPNNISLPTNLEFDPDNLESLPEGGMGLFLINSLMDAVEFSRDQDGFNSLVLTKYFQPNPNQEIIRQT